MKWISSWAQSGCELCKGCDRAVAAVRVWKTAALLVVVLHGLTFTAHLLKTLATPIISLVMGPHDMIQEGEIIGAGVRAEWKGTEFCAMLL